MRTRTLVATTILAFVALLGSCKKDNAADKGKTTDTKTTDKKPVDTKTDVKPDDTKPDDTKPDDTKPADPGTPTAPAGDTVTLKFTVPAVGAKWSEEKSQTLDLEIEANGQKLPFHQEGVEKKQVEVLEVSAEAVTKAKYTYQITAKQSVAGKSEDQPSPLSGKTYTLALTADGQLDVTTDAGAPSKEEFEQISKEEDDFGQPEKMSKLLASREFKKGEPVDLPADQIQGVMGASSGGKVTKLMLTYTGLDGTNPQFDMVLGMTQTTPGGDLQMDASGKITVDAATGQLVTMTMEGPVKLSGATPATGTMKVTGTRTPG